MDVAKPLDTQRQARVDELRREARITREFIAAGAKRLNRKGAELKTNVTDPDSAKMATSKGVIQGYAAQAAVDSAHQVIVAADITGSGSEQAMLLPMIDKSAPVRGTHTLITADAGYYNDDNIRTLHQRGIPALIADNAMRQRDERIANAHHKTKGEVLYDKCAAHADQAVPARAFQVPRRQHRHLPGRPHADQQWHDLHAHRRCEGAAVQST